jgi:hypothetical protein
LDVWGIDPSDDTMDECGGADTGVELLNATYLATGAALLVSVSILY